jgi:SAM-dependent methyltransferase
MRHGARPLSTRVAGRLRHLAKRARARAAAVTDRVGSVEFHGHRVPKRLIVKTGGRPADWAGVAENHMRVYDALCPVEPHHQILEVGCGVGRDAIPLAERLGPGGAYLGIDIMRDCIAWCRRHVTARHPNVRFEYADIRSHDYNRGGALVTQDYPLPVLDASQDRIFLQSVFTHLGERDMQHYLREFRRVLKPGGRVLLTLFLLDPETRVHAGETAKYTFAHGDGRGFYYQDADNPLRVVGLSPEALDRMLAVAGLRLAFPVQRGYWCANRRATHYQDIAVLARDDSPGEGAMAVDHVFVGAPRPGAAGFARDVLGGRAGIVLDNDTRRFAQLRREERLPCARCDLRVPAVPHRSVRFAYLDYSLQRMPDAREAGRVVVEAAALATDFVVIRGASFDQEASLRQAGLKLFYHDWTGNPCHLRTGQLTRVLAEAGLTRYRIAFRAPVTHAGDPAVLPLDAPPDQHRYDPERHGPKPSVALSIPAYREFVCFVYLKEDAELEHVEREVLRDAVSLESPQERPAIEQGLADFLDLGASTGDSMDVARHTLGGGDGVGIDNDPAKVAAATHAGYQCLLEDATKLSLPGDAVRFAVMRHFLEHLPNEDMVRDIIASSARVARDFLFIQGPYFDADDYLAAHGLKPYYSDWTGHTCHLTTDALEKILHELGLTEFAVYLIDPARNSGHPMLHSPDSPKDQHQYDPAKHPPKPKVRFDQPVFREFACFVKLREMAYWEALVRQGVRGTGGQAKQEALAGESRAARLLPNAARRVLLRPDDQPSPLVEAQRELLRARGWSYLRYLHLREGLRSCEGVRSVLSVGCGDGAAEVALAVENPNIQFTLTDIAPPGKELRRRLAGWGVENVRCGVLDIMAPDEEPHDLVMSVEVLEHIRDDATAAANMRALAREWVFALVPFASEADNRDEDELRRQWEAHEHCRVGYNEDDLRRLFPGAVDIRGCYWRDAGARWRAELSAAPDDALADPVTALRFLGQAENDLRPGVPGSREQAFGIRVLARP